MASAPGFLVSMTFFVLMGHWSGVMIFRTLFEVLNVYKHVFN